MRQLFLSLWLLFRPVVNSSALDSARKATMGFFFEFDTVNNIICCRWQGPITDDILLEGYSASGKLLASRPPCRGINDFSGVTSFDVSNETISRLAKMPSAVPADWTHVIVAPKGLLYGLARMFSILGENTRPNLHVVRTVEEAHALLEITSPQFSRLNVAGSRRNPQQLFLEWPDLICYTILRSYCDRNKTAAASAAAVLFSTRAGTFLEIPISAQNASIKTVAF